VVQVIVMTNDRSPLSDKELWRSLATPQNVAPRAVSEIDFAAWLEGRLSPEAAARVDAAVAADPELRRAALELSEVLGQPLPPAPPRLAVRAQALVGFEAERRVGAGSWLGRLLPRLTSHLFLERGAMAGIAILLAAMGFVMGGGLGSSYAYDSYAARMAAASSQQGTYFATELDLFAD
jgi:hypothetical protein